MMRKQHQLPLILIIQLLISYTTIAIRHQNARGYRAAGVIHVPAFLERGRPQPTEQASLHVTQASSSDNNDIIAQIRNSMEENQTCISYCSCVADEETDAASVVNIINFENHTNPSNDDDEIAAVSDCMATVCDAMLVCLYPDFSSVEVCTFEHVLDGLVQGLVRRMQANLIQRPSMSTRGTSSTVIIAIFHPEADASAQLVALAYKQRVTSYLRRALKAAELNHNNESDPIHVQVVVHNQKKDVVQNMWEKSLLFDDDDAAAADTTSTVDVSFGEFPMLVESILQAVTVVDEDGNEENKNTGDDDDDSSSSSLVAITTNELSSSNDSAEGNASSFAELEPAVDSSTAKESAYSAYDNDDNNSAVKDDDVASSSSTEEGAVQVLSAHETTPHEDGPAATTVMVEEEESVLDDFEIVSDDDGGAILSDDNNEESGVGVGIVGREEEQDAWVADEISNADASFVEASSSYNSDDDDLVLSNTDDNEYALETNVDIESGSVTGQAQGEENVVYATGNEYQIDTMAVVQEEEGHTEEDGAHKNNLSNTTEDIAISFRDDDDDEMKLQEMIDAAIQETVAEATADIGMLEAKQDEASLHGSMPILEFGSDANKIFEKVSSKLDKLARFVKQKGRMNDKKQSLLSGYIQDQKVKLINQIAGEEKNGVQSVFRQQLTGLREHYGRRFESMIDGIVENDGDSVQARQKKITAAASQAVDGFKAAARHAIPKLCSKYDELNETYNSVSSAELDGLVRDLMEVTSTLEDIEGSWESAVTLEEMGNDDGNEGAAPKGPPKWYKKLAARVLVLGINYAQGLLAIEGLRRAAAERDQFMPKLPLF